MLSKCGWRSNVKRAQKLRYRVFYKDGMATADATTMLARLDKDAFDKICDRQNRPWSVSTSLFREPP